MADRPGSIKTKDRILHAAVRLFSDRGYDKVSMRDIAAAVGVKAASIYNHYASKEELLKSIYEFYTAQQRQLFPSPEEHLRMAETASLTQLLSSLDIHYSPPEADDMMNRIIAIAFREINVDRDSEQFIRESIFDSVNNLLRPLFMRMVELGRLEPFDIDTFLCLFNYFSFAGAALYHSPLSIPPEKWSACLGLLFGTIINNDP